MKLMNMETQSIQPAIQFRVAGGWNHHRTRGRVHLDRPPIYHTANAHTHPFTLTFTPMRNFESLVNLTPLIKQALANNN